jgi:hypothetical protein
MADVLIRDVPDHVLRVIDANARRLGLSRTAYLRRQLAGEARGGPVSAADLAAFGETYADLGDDEVMSRAWR